MPQDPNYIWTGDSFRESDSNDAYILFLGSGRTMYGIINSNSTRVPEHIELFAGDDALVPTNLQCTDRDLVIHCNDTAAIQTASVCYFDPITNAYHGPYLPENSFTDINRQWFVWRKYLDVVIPYRSEIRLQMSGQLAPIEPGGQPSTGDAGTSIQVIQPPEEFNLSLEVKVYNDPQMTDLNLALNTDTPNGDFPVMVFNGSSFVQYPVVGATKATAGQYVVIDLSNLSYTDKVYIKWTWLNTATRAVAGFGSGVYPAYTLTNPDNIGFVWETSM